MEPVERSRRDEAAQDVAGGKRKLLLFPFPQVLTSCFNVYSTATSDSSTGTPVWERRRPPKVCRMHRLLIKEKQNSSARSDRLPWCRTAAEKAAPSCHHRTGRNKITSEPEDYVHFERLLVDVFRDGHHSPFRWRRPAQTTGVWRYNQLTSDWWSGSRSLCH